MAKGNDRDSRRRSPKDAPRKGAKKKVCIFCSDRIAFVDYKDINLLRRFMSERGKIRARRVSGNCSQHQAAVAVAIKTARELALLPYAQRTLTERTGRGAGRGGDRSRGAPERVEANEAPQAPADGGADDDEVPGDEGVPAEVTV